MTKEQFNKHEKVIQAWAKGADIQYKSIFTDNWEDAVDPTFAINYEYRVKPSPEYVPFTDEDIIVGELIKHDDYVCTYMILKQGRTGVYIIGITGEITEIYYKNLLKSYKFVENNGVCGKLAQIVQ